MLFEELQDIALGIAQFRYWDLRKRYNRMIAELEPSYPVDGIIVDPGRLQLAREWFDFCQEHEGWSFLLFDPVDIEKMVDDSIEPIPFGSEA